MRSFDRLRGRGRIVNSESRPRTCFLTCQFPIFFQGSIDRQRCVDQAPDETRRRVGRWTTITRGTRPAWRTSRWRKWSRTRTSRSISNPPLPHPCFTAICWPILESRPSPPYWPVVCQRRPFCDLSFTYETDQFASGWVFRVASRENTGDYYRIATLMLMEDQSVPCFSLHSCSREHSMDLKRNVLGDWKKKKCLLRARFLERSARSRECAFLLYERFHSFFNPLARVYSTRRMLPIYGKYRYDR